LIFIYLAFRHSLRLRGYLGCGLLQVHTHAVHYALYRSHSRAFTPVATAHWLHGYATRFASRYTWLVHFTFTTFYSFVCAGLRWFCTHTASTRVYVRRCAVTRLHRGYTTLYCTFSLPHLRPRLVLGSFGLHVHGSHTSTVRSPHILYLRFLSWFGLLRFTPLSRLLRTHYSLYVPTLDRFTHTAATSQFSSYRVLLFHTHTSFTHISHPLKRAVCTLHVSPAFSGLRSFIKVWFVRGSFVMVYVVLRVLSLRRLDNNLVRLYSSHVSGLSLCGCGYALRLRLHRFAFTSRTPVYTRSHLHTTQFFTASAPGYFAPAGSTLVGRVRVPSHRQFALSPGSFAFALTYMLPYV